MKKLINCAICLLVILSFTCNSATGAPAANDALKAGQIFELYGNIYSL